MKGRLIFGFIGYIIGGFLGAVAGALLGYYLVDKKQVASRFDPKYQRALIEFTYELMGYVARSAGRVNEEHIAIANQYMRIMQLSQELKNAAREAFARGKSADFSIDRCISSYRAVFGHNLELVSYLLEIQIQVALSDGVLTENERGCLISIAVKLGISSESMSELIEKRYQEMAFRNGSYSYSGHESYNSSSGYGNYDYESNDSRQSSSGYSSSDSTRLNAAYALLGVDKDASDDEVKKAHKRMMLKYHPDRLASQGLTDDMIKVYTEKAKDIQAAFDLIKKERGIK